MNPERLATAKAEVDLAEGLGYTPPAWAVHDVEHANDPAMTMDQASSVIAASLSREVAPGLLAEARSIIDPHAVAREQFNQIVDEMAELAETALQMTSADARTHARSEAMAVQAGASTAQEAVGNLRKTYEAMKAGAVCAPRTPSSDAVVTEVREISTAEFHRALGIDVTGF